VPHELSAQVGNRGEDAACDDVTLAAGFQDRPSGSFLCAIARAFLWLFSTRADPPALPTPMLPHSAKRSFHFGGEGTPVA
jgi:hypothetical protein